jgi:hypothetical protein
VPRRRIELDVDELEKLAAMHCTREEVAGFFGIAVKTVQRRLKESRYADAWERGIARGRVSLRRAQFRVAENGNPTMLIWLGKQWLRQSDAPLQTSESKSALIELMDRLRASATDDS